MKKFFENETVTFFVIYMTLTVGGYGISLAHNFLSKILVLSVLLIGAMRLVSILSKLKLSKRNSDDIKDVIFKQHISEQSHLKHIELLQKALPAEVANKILNEVYDSSTNS